MDRNDIIDQLREYAEQIDRKREYTDYTLGESERIAQRSIPLLDQWPAADEAETQAATALTNARLVKLV